MFDKYDITSGPSSMSASVNVQEHKAPTDDSIRLLNEMHEKARANLIKQYSIDDNVVKGNVYYWNNPLTFEIEVDVYFTINGKEFHSTEKIRKNIIDTEYEATARLVKCMSDAILSALMGHIEALN